jgi:hypothetical protein
LSGARPGTQRAALDEQIHARLDPLVLRHRIV